MSVTTDVIAVPRREPASPRRPSIPALEPERSALAMRLGLRAPVWHPVVVFLVGLVACYLLLAAATTALGLAFTSWILPLGGFEAADARPVEWLADRRTPLFDALSFVGSELSGQFVLPGLVGGVVVISAFQRRWLLAGFVLAAIVPRVGDVPDDGVLRRPRPARRPAPRRAPCRTRAFPRATSPRRLPSTPASRSSSRRA